MLRWGDKKGSANTLARLRKLTKTHLKRSRDTLISPITLSSIWQSAAFLYIKEAHKATKLWEKIFLKSALLILTVSTNAFHSTNLFCYFSRYHAPTNSVAPSSVHKPHTAHNSSIRSDVGLTLETSSFASLYGGQFSLPTQLIKPNYLILVEFY